MNYIIEGGASGHLKHPYEYIDDTLQDLIDLIRDLFSNNIQDITEKIDGYNIQVSKNTDDRCIFIRNKTDLNSEKGGMYLEDILSKWNDKPNVRDVFYSTCQKIEESLENIPYTLFNERGYRKFINCECVSEGKTNVMYYNTMQVFMHDVWIYKKQDGEWVHVDTNKDILKDIRNKISKNINCVTVTPNVYIKTSEDLNKKSIEYISQLKKIFNNKYNSSIREVLERRFDEYLSEKGIQLSDTELKSTLFKRWVLGEKGTNIKYILNSITDEKARADIKDIDSNARTRSSIKDYCYAPFKKIFTNIGNTILKNVNNLINSTDFKDSTIEKIYQDYRDSIQNILKNGSEDDINKTYSILQILDTDVDINNTEGIVFLYKDKLMKVTGSFAGLNQIFGISRNIKL